MTKKPTHWSVWELLIIAGSVISLCAQTLVESVFLMKLVEALLMASKNWHFFDLTINRLVDARADFVHVQSTKR